jgi:hypothetical protein
MSDADFRAGGDQMRAHPRGSQQSVSSTLKPEIKTSIRNRIKTGSGIAAIIGSLIGIDCAAWVMFSYIVYQMNLQNIALQESGALAVLSEFERIKYGDADSESVAGIMNKVNARSSYEVQEINVAANIIDNVEIRKTGVESDAYKYAVEGRNITTPSPITVASLNHTSINMWLSSMSRTRPALAWFLGGFNEQGALACRVAGHPVFQLGMFIVGTVAAVFSLKTITVAGVLKIIGGTIIASVAVTLLTEAAINYAIDQIVPQMLANQIGDAFGLDAYGQDFVTKVVAGSGALMGSRSQSRGVLTATVDSAMAVHDEHQTYLASLAEDDRAGRSPFDISSVNTFAGMFLTSFLPVFPALSQPATFLGGIGSLFSDGFMALIPSVRAADTYATERARLSNEWCEYSEGAKAAGLSGYDIPFHFAVDIFCNPYRVTSQQHHDPADIIEYLFDQRMVSIGFNDARGGSEALVHKARYAKVKELDDGGFYCNPIVANDGGWLFDGEYPESGAGLGDLTLDGFYGFESDEYNFSRRNCGQMTDLYAFQKTYYERMQNVGELERPNITCLEYDVIAGECAVWDPREQIIGTNPFFWLLRMLGIAFFPEETFIFTDLTGNRWREPFSREALRGKMGIDDGSKETNMYSLFFIDRDIMYGINGDMMFGSTVR